MFRQRTDKVIVLELSPDFLFTTKSLKYSKKKESGKIYQRLNLALPVRIYIHFPVTWMWILRAKTCLWGCVASPWKAKHW